MATTKLSKTKQEKALRIVAAWLGPKMGHDGPAPTGHDAAYRGEGPELNPAWDWPDRPTPTILLESSLAPDDWAVRVSMDPKVLVEMDLLGIYAEPYASYALCLYPND